MKPLIGENCNMPKINRARIVNFSYNNNNRHILDEMFDFYGGVNALLSLVNGGGKSVLVQILLQPILPKQTLLHRKIGDFFISRNTPSYIMLEWKLDENAGYLLTGIAIMPSVTHNANEDEPSASVRYFTFIHEYEEGNPLDIKAIPVTEAVGNSLRIASYSEFRKFMQKEIEKNPMHMDLFDSGRDEQRAYERKLISFGISKEEWRDLIVRINEAEHGVSEVFSQCRTSKKVMEQWVIKYIEKVLNKSDDNVSDHSKLETMMSQVALDMVDNEQHVKEYQRISEFVKNIEAVKDLSDNISKSLDDEIQLKKRIRDAYQALIDEDARLNDEAAGLEQQNIELNEELHHIDLEENSLKIHRYNDELANLSFVINELKEQLVDVEEKKQGVLHKLDVQSAAEKLQVIREKTQSMAAEEELLENAKKDQEQLMRDLNRIKYALKLLYENIISGLDYRRTSLEEGKNRKANDKAEILKKNRERQKSIDELNKELGGIYANIKNFEAYERTVMELLGITLYRNPMLKELDPRDVNAAEQSLSMAAEALKQEIENKNDTIVELSQALSLLEQDAEAARLKQIDAKMELSSVNDKIEDYENDRGIMQSVLLKHNIDENYLFDKRYILSRLQDNIDAWNDKCFHLRMDISGIEQLLNGIEKGLSYLPSKLTALMEEHNLPCYTGEQFLNEMDTEKRKELLRKNPLLPYALIVTEKEHSQLIKLIEGEELGQIVPVIRYNDREMELGILPGGMDILASSQIMKLEPEDVDNYIQSLKDSREKLLLELQQAEITVKVANGEYQQVFQFRWAKAEADGLYEMQHQLQKDLELLDNKLGLIRDQITAQKAEQEALKLSVEGLSQEYRIAEKRITDFAEFIKQNDKYMRDLQAALDFQHQIELLNSDIRQALKKYVSLENDLQEIQNSIHSVNSERESVLDKYLGVKDASEVDVVPDENDLNDLEGKLKAYQSRQSSDVERITVKIKELQRDIERENRELGRLGLQIEDYQSAVYSEVEVKRLETESKSLDCELNALEEKLNKAEKERIRIESVKKHVEESLNGYDIIPPQDIKGNFKERRGQINKRQEAIRKREKEIQSIQKRISELRVKVEAKIDDIKQIIGYGEKLSYSSIDAEIESMLDNLKAAIKITNGTINKFRDITKELGSRYEKNEVVIISEAVRNIMLQINTLQRTFDKYYYLSERLDSYTLNLNDVLKIMESKVLQLQHARNDLVEHAFMEVMRIYHEIPKISENSAVEIDGVRRRVLEITYDKIDNELSAKEKLSVYIYDCLESLKQSIKNKEDDGKIRRDLEKFIQTKELLNVVCSLDSFVVKAYKIDIYEKNRRMMAWEDLIIKNSGGEKFVAYFSLLVALISYSRGRNKDTLVKKDETKVLIMDNPFGPITSGHLLKPMFDIAEKYNTQLICLSDIKQGFVIDNFKLIYMIKIRQNMMKQEYLEFEPQLLADLKADERLEKVYLYTRTEQQSLFM
jgi:chromosome segregation ATPase